MLWRGRERHGQKGSVRDVSRDLGSGAPTSPARSRSTSHELRRLPVHGGGAGGLHPARQLCGRVDLCLLRLGHSIRRRRCGRKVPRRACTEVTRGGLARHSAGEAGLSGERGWACGGGRALGRVSALNDVLEIRFTPAPYSCSWRKACSSAPWATPKLLGATATSRL